MTEDAKLMTVTFAPEWVSVVVRQQAPLAHLSSGMEAGLAWMFGRGVTRFAVTREKMPGPRKGEEVVDVSILAVGDTTKALLHSSVTTLQTLAKEGYLGRKLSGDIERKYRAVELEKDEGTVMAHRGLKLESTIGMVAYGLADTLISFFLDGVEKAEYETSSTEAILWLGKGFTPAQLQNIIERTPDYKPLDPVSRFPWKH